MDSTLSVRLDVEQGQPEFRCGGAGWRFHIRGDRDRIDPHITHLKGEFAQNAVRVHGDNGRIALDCDEGRRHPAPVRVQNGNPVATPKAIPVERCTDRIDDLYQAAIGKRRHAFAHECR